MALATGKMLISDFVKTQRHRLENEISDVLGQMCLLKKIESEYDLIMDDDIIRFVVAPREGVPYETVTVERHATLVEIDCKNGRLGQYLGERIAEHVKIETIGARRNAAYDDW